MAKAKGNSDSRADDGSPGDESPWFRMRGWFNSTRRTRQTRIRHHLRAGIRLTCLQWYASKLNKLGLNLARAKSCENVHNLEKGTNKKRVMRQETTNPAHRGCSVRHWTIARSMGRASRRGRRAQPAATRVDCDDGWGIGEWVFFLCWALNTI